MSKQFPKILIIGETFHRNSGGGITLSNLFNDWPRENLANAVDFRDPNMEKDFGDIELYELYNSKMVFNLFKIKQFGSFRSNSIVVDALIKKSFIPSVKYYVKKIANIFLEYSGIKNIIFSYRIDPDFLKWISSFKPEYIYTQLSTRESIIFISKLHDHNNIPIAIHIMDDWPSTISSKGLFKNYLKKKIDREFNSLLNKTSVFLSISESMSEEYAKRYKKDFIPFHNPIDLNIWNKSIALEEKTINQINILHAGRIGTGITKSLLDVAETIQDLNIKNIHVNLYIQSSKIDLQFRKKISQYACVRINPAAEYKDISSIMKNADILILCNDFDERGKTFLKFSMPTKTSEYMISKVPILVFSDYSSAVYKHAKKYGWAYLVGENNKSLLKIAFLELIENSELRIKLAEKAYHFAKTNYDSTIIRDIFRNIFINPI